MENKYIIILWRVNYLTTVGTVGNNINYEKRKMHRHNELKAKVNAPVHPYNKNCLYDRGAPGEALTNHP